MAIGRIVIGGGLDTTNWGSDQEVIYAASYILTTVRASYGITTTLTEDSPIGEDLSAVYRIMIL